MLIRTLYRFASVFIVHLVVPFIGIFHRRFRTTRVVRGSWERNLEVFVNENSDPILWFHGASHGEFEQGRPVMELIKEKLPGHRLLFTIFSPSGFDFANRAEVADYVSYLPLDTPGNAKRFLGLVKPEMAIFIKNDFWPNFLMALEGSKTPILFLSSRFLSSQAYFGFAKGLYMPLFRSVSKFFVQNKESATALIGNGIESVVVSGDTRMDRVTQLGEVKDPFPELKGFISDQPIFVFGSVWPEDLDRFGHFINYSSHKFIVAPHDVGTDSVRFFTSKIKDSLTLSSFLESSDRTCDVLIIDNIGMLSRLYFYARYAYVGGAFSQGLHNILEPAAFGIPVFFGRDISTLKFHEAGELQKRGGAFEVDSSEELEELVDLLETDVEMYRKSSISSSDYIRESKGATQEITTYILNHLK